jgi:hypothetical protein
MLFQRMPSHGDFHQQKPRIFLERGKTLPGARESSCAKSSSMLPSSGFCKISEPAQLKPQFIEKPTIGPANLRTSRGKRGLLGCLRIWNRSC